MEVGLYKWIHRGRTDYFPRRA